MSPARRIIAMAGVIVLLLGSGLGLLLAAVAGEPSTDISAFGLGTGLLAVSLGMRHAFDVDHISMIDNTTRALVRGDRRPLAVGFFFSLGHSSVVFVLTLLVGIGIHAFDGQVLSSRSALHLIADVVGTSVSAGFLYLIAAINVVVLLSAVRSARRSAASRSRYEPAALEIRGPLGRVFSRASRGVDASWKMYPVGVLFGLGFDTATEVALLVISAVAAVGGLPFWAELSLALLFAGGMCLFDTVDGWLMSATYRWAADAPARRVRFNIVITGLSVAVAGGIATFELGGLLGRRFGWNGPVASAVAAVDPGMVGLAISVLFALAWAVAVVGSRWRSAKPQEG
jgi:nickel/cobalt transporter (NiCoT) family protein